MQTSYLNNGASSGFPFVRGTATAIGWQSHLDMYTQELGIRLPKQAIPTLKPDIYQLGKHVFHQERPPMLTTLMMITPFILFACGLQYCLNQLIAEDLENFNQDRSQSMDDASLT